MDKEKTTAIDLRMLCAALGFAVVVVKGDEAQRDKAKRARVLAGLIEEFCDDSLAAANENNTSIDELIEKIKNDLLRNGEADMQKDRRTLLKLYDRLRQRYVAYADDNMVADRVLELIDAEMESRPNAY